jgi:DNA polymerase delta subunit 1
VYGKLMTRSYLTDCVLASLVAFNMSSFGSLSLFALFLIDSSYSIANGFTHNAKVIYGDTDSVMVKFVETDMATVFEMAKKAAEVITGHFVAPIKLEFEKVYFPYLLISKKRYAGLYWSRLESYDKMDAKGIVTVRRDNCPLVANLVNACLQKV